MTSSSSSSSSSSSGKDRYNEAKAYLDQAKQEGTDFMNDNVCTNLRSNMGDGDKALFDLARDVALGLVKLEDSHRTSYEPTGCGGCEVDHLSNECARRRNPYPGKLKAGRVIAHEYYCKLCTGRGHFAIDCDADKKTRETEKSALTRGLSLIPSSIGEHKVVGEGKEEKANPSTTKTPCATKRKGEGKFDKKEKEKNEKKKDKEKITSIATAIAIATKTTKTTTAARRTQKRDLGKAPLPAKKKIKRSGAEEE